MSHTYIHEARAPTVNYLLNHPSPQDVVLLAGFTDFVFTAVALVNGVFVKTVVPKGMRFLGYCAFNNVAYRVTSRKFQERVDADGCVLMGDLAPSEVVNGVFKLRLASLEPGWMLGA